MKSNSSLWLVIIAAVAVSVAFFSNIQSVISGKNDTGLIAISYVNGVEVVHGGVPYTLGYNQQTKLLQYINSAVPTIPQKERQSFDFDKIIIYSLTNAPVEITPINARNGDIIFASASLNQGKALRETSAGDLAKLIQSSFTSS